MAWWFAVTDPSSTEPKSWAEMSTTQHIPPVAPAPKHRAVAAEDPAPSAGLDPTSEPVIIGHSITLILAALVGLGWLTIPSTTIDAIGTLVAVVLSTVGAVMARARVSPLSGGLWSAVEQYVRERVAAELAKYKV